MSCLLKTFWHRVLSGVFVVAMVGFVGGDPAPQPQTTITREASGTFHVDWQGVESRTYFIQFSLDLETWLYAPFMDFGDGPKSRGMESDAEKFFVRLHYGDYPEIDSLDEAMAADFDGDGLSNIFEVTHGYDPLVVSSTSDGADAVLDPDADGLGNVSELSVGSHPMQRDHPILQLEVSVD